MLHVERTPPSSFGTQVLPPEEALLHPPKCVWALYALHVTLASLRRSSVVRRPYPPNSVPKVWEKVRVIDTTVWGLLKLSGELSLSLPHILYASIGFRTMSIFLIVLTCIHSATRAASHLHDAHETTIFCCRNKSRRITACSLPVFGRR